MEDKNQDFDKPIKNLADELFEMINERIRSEKLLNGEYDELVTKYNQAIWAKRQRGTNWRPKNIQALVFIIFFTILFTTAIYLRPVLNEAADKVEEQEIISQIETLDEISKNLSNLNHFLKIQKEKLELEGNSLQLLRDEQKKLEPLLDADRKVVKALFLEQEQRQRKNKWYDRTIGAIITLFCGGVLQLILWFFKKNPIKV